MNDHALFSENFFSEWATNQQLHWTIQGIAEAIFFSTMMGVAMKCLTSSYFKSRRGGSFARENHCTGRCVESPSSWENGVLSLLREVALADPGRCWARGALRQLRAAHFVGMNTGGASKALEA
jgi:hypothetical protein